MHTQRTSKSPQIACHCIEMSLILRSARSRLAPRFRFHRVAFSPCLVVISSSCSLATMYASHRSSTSSRAASWSSQSRRSVAEGSYSRVAAAACNLCAFFPAAITEPVAVMVSRRQVSGRSHTYGLSHEKDCSQCSRYHNERKDSRYGASYISLPGARRNRSTAGRSSLVATCRSCLPAAFAYRSCRLDHCRIRS